MDKEITINDLKINYKQKGKGKPILILHGWGGSSDSWKNVIEIVGGNKFNVICPDLPGFGKSDDPKEPWNINDYIQFVFEFTKQVKIEDFTLIGHSFGGGLSTKITGEHNNKVDRLILCNSAVIRAKERLSLRQKVARTSSRIARPFLTNDFFKEKIEPKLKPLVYRIAGNYDYFSANDVMKKTFKKVFVEDLRAYAAYVKRPTLIVWGELDQITPLEDAYELNKIIENSELSIIKNVGHAPHLKTPEELSNIIIDFLNKEI
jgi:pimeloyl-ACP methyl ester carboxylesterase